MDDWGDPWQDDAAPKHPPAIDVHILADRQSKERVVTPVLTGFFEDQQKWCEPDSHDVWAAAHDEPAAPVQPAEPAEPAEPAAPADAPVWDLPDPEPVTSDKPPESHGAALATTHTAALEPDTPQPAEEDTSDAASDDSFHEPTPTPDAHKESGVPPATPTAHEIDSSDSGTTIGPDAAGFAALDSSTPPASRPHSEEFESGISTRPSTSPSEASHGDGLSDSTRTSFEDDVGPQGLTASSEAGPDKADDATQTAGEPENKTENEHQATTSAPNEETTEPAPNQVPEETDDDTNEITTEHEPEDRVESEPEDLVENEFEGRAENELDDEVEDTCEDRVEDTHEDTPEDAFDDDDFGDFEEEADEVLEDEIHEDETSNTVESPVDAGPPSPNHGHAPAQDLSGFVPSSPRPFVKADFAPNLSLIDQLFPTTGDNNELQEVDDSPIKPTNARKAWYRLTRIETLHEVQSEKDHDSYVRVGWQASTVRAETNQIVGRWASEDRINGRTLLGGRPGAMFGWDSPKFSPASSVFSFHSHKRNASAATTPKKAVFDLEETRQRPVSLTVPPLRKPSISTAIDVPQFSWSTAVDEPNEPAASSAPHSKTAFANSKDGSNPWGAAFAEKSPTHEIMPISAPPVKTSFEDRKSPFVTRSSFEDSDAWKPAERSFGEGDTWGSAKESFESQGTWEPAKTTLEEADAWDAAKRSLEETDPFEPPKASFEEANAWESTRKSIDQQDASLQDKASLDEGDAWKTAETSSEKPELPEFQLPPQPPVEIPVNCKPVKNSQDQIIGWKLDHDAIKKAAAEEKAAALQTLQEASEPRPPHTRAVSDSNILHVMSPFDNPFAPPEAEKPEPTPDEDAQAQSGEKKKKKRLSWLTFPKKKKNNDLHHKRSVSTSSFLAVSNSTAVPPKSSSLPSWESPWAKMATKSPLANEVTGPDPEPEIARKEYEPEMALRKHEPNPWDNAFDNAWDDARPSTAKSNASHRDSVLISKPELPAIDTAVRPPSPREVVTTPKLPAIDTNPEPHKADSPVHEEKSWGNTVESPMASPSVMTPDENPWGDPWKATSVPPAPITLSVDPPSVSKPATKLAPLDTSFKPQETDDDDWGEMVESPAASSPVLAPPPSGQWGLPRSVSPIGSPISKTTRTHPPSPLVPAPIRSATMPLSPTTSGLASPPRVNTPKSTSNWLPKPTNHPRPLSPLNPARSSTLPISPTLGSLQPLSPSPVLEQKEVFRPAPISIAPADSDPWDSVDFSVFDKPASAASRNASHNRTSSSPLPSPDPTSTAPTITFDNILGGATRTDRSSSTPLTFDQILQPSRERSGSARTFDDILAQPGQLSRANSQQSLKATAAGQAQAGPVTNWAEQDKEAVKKFVAALPDMSYMLR
ncbi:uncharacterized protein BKCO1_340007 [Diplodia corticola]|uniref:Uncharacterized protein n=1 Tax=Diplodia corticola TaxID=236234 RepID=A0A1J9QX56_9PEZI|nr:uncharacterized protein BKCO1_340007 [Diplodia corticola]OJD32969.1 hypothetical protein BKCO1_340007 [Diplodia corticola]